MPLNLDGLLAAAKSDGEVGFGETIKGTASDGVYIAYTDGSPHITLDHEFTAAELEEIAAFVRRHQRK